MSTTATHPNVDRARAYLAAFSAHDLDAVGEHLADDVVWRVGGYHPLAGTYRGKADVLDYLARAAAESEGTLSLEPESILASDAHLAMFVKVSGERQGRTLDTTMAQIVQLAPDGRWQAFWALSDDQPAIDAFWA